MSHVRLKIKTSVFFWVLDNLNLDCTIESSRDCIKIQIDSMYLGQILHCFSGHASQYVGS